MNGRFVGDPAPLMQTDAATVGSFVISPLLLALALGPQADR